MSDVGARANRRPWVEGLWEESRGGPASWLLRLLALPYALASRVARALAARGRRRVDGLVVVAIGGITVGGAGKTTLARWAAQEALRRGHRPAILLRGYGSDAGRTPAIVPMEATAWPRAGSVAARYGDEAVAHRAALPDEVLVIVGSDRRGGAMFAREQGATAVILDDGWEQGRLAWDSLWVVLDPMAPQGNGWSLPAGPLRRPLSTIREGHAIALIAEASGEMDTRAWTSVRAAAREGQPIVRFERRVERWTTVQGHAAEAPRGTVILVSSVGSPERLTRFLRGENVSMLTHVAFPDHAAWDHEAVRAAIADGARIGSARAVAVVATDKDAVRARGLGDVGLPVLLLATGLTPVDDPAPLVAVFRAPFSGQPRPMATARPIR